MSLPRDADEEADAITVNSASTTGLNCVNNHLSARCDGDELDEAVRSILGCRSWQRRGAVREVACRFENVRRGVYFERYGWSDPPYC